MQLDQVAFAWSTNGRFATFPAFTRNLQLEFSVKKSSLLFLLLLIAFGAGAFYYFRDTTAPTVTLSPDSGAIAPVRPLELRLEDTGTGIRDLTVTLLQQGGATPLMSKSFPAGTTTIREDLSLAAANLSEGPFDIVITVGDHAVYHFGKGNRAEQSFSFSFDRTPPLATVISTGHNFVQGGSALVTFRLAEEVSKAGIVVADRFIPAHRQSSGFYACLVPFPNDLPEKDFVPRIQAVDLAGNEAMTGIFYRAKEQTFRQRRINIDDRFLQAKTPEFKALVPEAGTPVDIFLAVNRDLRQSNREKLVGFAGQTSATPLWEGAFLRQPQSATLALFGDRRSYYYNDQKIDSQIHLGIDLASVVQAPVHAANTGRVVFAGYLGIYGQCVIIDHGLGLQTLYGHLSKIDVAEAENVSKNQIIGNTGLTGMAGGDHLHFGIVVAGVPVNPIEWWDAQWLKNNVDSRLSAP
ncbi:M23 family metallopeptidase [Desulfuromonas sp. AOP6]|uniref:M23 family metallopeptidase n=1 Tax=Desulfuromonas sp. AOP6 TaxID=1566351 RepID=UPI00127F9F25|nr:M23 family metallopeptidase [Desulfuromonas sp. AOP6]BCA80962.1 peptidase M24 [Desulfuromonas sp. AOP6]